jgi:3-(3-hydroxy-phenyl)propionate hydroxylase
LGAPERRIETLDDLLSLRGIPLGWAAIVRPDRTVMCEGPAEQASALVFEALKLLGEPAHAEQRLAHPSTAAT